MMIIVFQGFLLGLSWDSKISPCRNCIRQHSFKIGSKRQSSNILSKSYTVYVRILLRCPRLGRRVGIPAGDQGGRLDQSVDCHIGVLLGVQGGHRHSNARSELRGAGGTRTLLEGSRRRDDTHPALEALSHDSTHDRRLVDGFSFQLKDHNGRPRIAGYHQIEAFLGVCAIVFLHLLQQPLVRVSDVRLQSLHQLRSLLELPQGRHGRTRGERRSRRTEAIPGSR
mmetsp:Transcript_16866/g.38674  ORF Transcript_16866/g.38674 Transcript_16866/m.38674 type:complete len:225 (-) Transcript_16866:436-1110(-)